MASTVPDWASQDEAWDRMDMAGEFWPGIWEAEGTVARDIDKKKRKGKDGWKLTDEGYRGAEITLICRIWIDPSDPEETARGDYEELQRLLPLIHPRRKGGTRTPIEVNFPPLALMGINQLYVSELGIPKIESGVLTLRLKVSEWFPQPKDFDGITHPVPEFDHGLRPVNYVEPLVPGVTSNGTATLAGTPLQADQKLQDFLSNAI